MEEATAITLKWVFGFNKSIGAVNLSDADKELVFFAAAHTGVIYDLRTDRQKHLIGHTNEISCCCTSKDKGLIITADHGEDSMIIVWEVQKALPIKTISCPHVNGVQSLDISDDLQYIVSLSKAPGSQQQICIWNWLKDDGTPFSSSVIKQRDYQTAVRFHPTDSRQLISCGTACVIFWTLDGQSIIDNCPPLSAKDFKHPVGNFTQALFIPETELAVSATVDGDVVLWGNVEEERRAIKIVRLHDNAINCLVTTNDYLVTGGEDGFVRLFDFQFRLVAWYEELNVGPITAISFSNKAVSRYEETSTLLAPDLFLSTSKGAVISLDPKVFDELDIKNRGGKQLLQFQDSHIHALAAHPYQHQLAVTGYSGLLQLWDYHSDGRKLKLARKFEKLQGNALAFNRRGDSLAVGFTNGALKIVSARTLKDLPKCTFRNSKDAITELTFSSNSAYLAVADADHCVSIYKCTNRKINEQDEDDYDWQYIGKYRSHYQPITGLLFVEDESGPRLLSVGEDRQLVEYDLPASSVSYGLAVKETTKIEQTAIPTSFAWYEEEHCLVMANDIYKFKLLNGESKLCRKTLLGPTYGGPVCRMIPIPNNEKNYFAYATHQKVIGLIKLPLDGNPNKGVGIIAHPKEISNLAVSYDGKYLFTCGGADLTVNMWSVDLRALEETAAKGGEGIEPFAALIEGGQEGQFWNEIKEYFYYAQIKSQGEDSLHPHHLSSTVPLDEIPNIMRALGFYPTEREVQDIVNEVKFSKYVQTAQYTSEVDFETLIKLYVNHRPVFGIGKQQFQQAFSVLQKFIQSNTGSSAFNDTDGKVMFGNLLKLMQEKGETMAPTELAECLEALLGDQYQQPSEWEDKIIDEKQFAEEILGFEDYN